VFALCVQLEQQWLQDANKLGRVVEYLVELE
jgi:hypothetical protein